MCGRCLTCQAKHGTPRWRCVTRFMGILDSHVYNVLTRVLIILLQIDPLRRFYTSLLQQNPESEMARRWCAIHGLLERDDAEEWVAEQARKKGRASPTKAPAKRTSTGTKSQPKPKAKKKAVIAAESDVSLSSDSDAPIAAKKPKKKAAAEPSVKAKAKTKPAKKGSDTKKRPLKGDELFYVCESCHYHSSPVHT